jgi:hypothetical protein
MRVGKRPAKSNCQEKIKESGSSKETSTLRAIAFDEYAIAKLDCGCGFSNNFSSPFL